MTSRWVNIFFLAAAAVVFAYALGDLLDVWQMEPLVVLIVSAMALLVGSAQGQKID